MDKLYKYSQYHAQTFQNNSLKISLPKDFNDILDSKFNLTDNDIKRLSDKTGVNQVRIRYLLLRFELEYILCLSAKSPTMTNSANMWGLYADSGKGLVFEFENEKIKKRNQDYYYHVEYIPQINQYEFIENYIVNSVENEEGAVQQLLLSKSDHWKFEEEIRLLFYPFADVVIDIEDNHKSYLARIKNINEIIDQEILRTVRFSHNSFRNICSSTGEIVDYIFVLSNFQKNRLKKLISIDKFVNQLCDHVSYITNNSVSKYANQKIISRVSSALINDSLTDKSYSIAEKYIIKFLLNHLIEPELPFPNAIYLGWNFDQSKRDEIIKYCEHNKISLYMLTGKIYHSSGEFELINLF